MFFGILRKIRNWYTRLRNPPPKPKEYRFAWQIHPFDIRRYFSVKALTQEEANSKAAEIYTGMIAA